MCRWSAAPLRSRRSAIKAAKRWKYDSVNGTPSDRTTLAVTFKEGAAPKVQQVMLAGVSGCIPFPARIRVTGYVMASRLLSRVEPIYPPEAKTEHVEGIVVLRVTISKDGSVYKAENVSGPPTLVPAAVEAVKQWKYDSIPAKRRTSRSRDHGRGKFHLVNVFARMGHPPSIIAICFGHGRA